MAFSAKIRKNGYDVKMESGADVRRYLMLMGTSDPRRLRIYEWRRGGVV